SAPTVPGTPGRRVRGDTAGPQRGNPPGRRTLSRAGASAGSPGGSAAAPRGNRDSPARKISPPEWSSTYPGKPPRNRFPGDPGDPPGSGRCPGGYRPRPPEKPRGAARSSRGLRRGTGQRAGHDGLRFAHNSIQVRLALEALRVDFVDVFGARGPRGKPA